MSPGLALAYDEEGSILVRTEGSLVESDLSGASASSAAIGAPREGYGYAICYLCGRAEPETDKPKTTKDGKTVDHLPEALVRHRRLRGSATCEAKIENHWRHMVLAGAIRTETLRIELKGQLALPAGDDGLRSATTWMVALQLAAGEVLGVDSREVGGLLAPRPTGASFVYDVILYDQVAGGVGHCRALLESWADLMNAARRRLSCPNAACTNACHRCLLAFESQRYEPLLRRRKLLDHLAPGWPLLQQRAERDGIHVVPVFRGGVEVRESLAQAPAAEITVVAGSIGPQAMADDGWLRWLLRHADSSGRARLVIDRLPNPDADDERIIALRLRLTMEMGKMSVYAARAGAAAVFPWRLSTSSTDTQDVYFAESPLETDMLGPGWLAGASRIFRASGADAAREARARVTTLVAGARPCKLSDFEPDEATPVIVVHNVPRLATGAQATFRHWLENASGEPLNARPLRDLKIVDPYLHTDWQISLLEDVVKLFREGGCDRVEVETYAPAPEKEGAGYGAHRTLSAATQQERVAKISGDMSWRPLPLPTDSLLRQHRRYIEGSRQDGSHFLVLLERGLDFIAFDRRRNVRVTRESYLVVKEG